METLRSEVRIGLIAGDVQTENDAERLLKAGGESVWPLVTGGACHLDARMVGNVLNGVDLGKLDLLFIENVGNLVCPSSFDLGELMKVVLISTTEGDDKPLKYPSMFRRSELMVVNKTDLLGMSDFSMQRVVANARSINPGLQIQNTCDNEAIAKGEIMCLAVPGRILEIFEENGLKMAKVDYGGARNSACLASVPEVEVGDYVIVHAGLAISVLDEEEAHLTLEALREMSELGQESSIS